MVVDREQGSAGTTGAQQPDDGDLTSVESALLRRHGGIPEPTQTALHRLDERSQAATSRDWTASYPISEAASLLGLSVQDLQLLAEGGALLVIPGPGDDEARVPDWQITAERTLLPHLAGVLSVMPHPIPTVTVRAFMTRPTTDLREPEGAAISPAQWLALGRSPLPVLEMARTMGEQD